MKKDKLLESFEVFEIEHDKLSNVIGGLKVNSAEDCTYYWGGTYSYTDWDNGHSESCWDGPKKPPY